MFDNKGKTTKGGDEISSSPWWTPLPETEDEDRIDLRLNTLRGLIFGHGLRRLLNRLIDAHLINPDLKPFVDEATDYKYMSVHYQLISFSKADKPRDVSLTFIRDVFSLSDKTSPTKIRDGCLSQMTAFGLWEAEYDAQSSNIRAGVTAKVFHEKIFTPVRRHFMQNLKGGPLALIAICALSAAEFIIVLYGAERVSAYLPFDLLFDLNQYALHPSDQISV